MAATRMRKNRSHRCIERFVLRRQLVEVAPDLCVIGASHGTSLSQRRPQWLPGLTNWRRRDLVRVGRCGVSGGPCAEWRGRRHRNRKQHAEHDRHRHVRRIGVPQPIAQAVEPLAVVAGAQPAVFVEVRDITDLRKREAPAAAARRRPADLEFAEAGGKAPQLLVAQLLVMEHQDAMTVDRPYGGAMSAEEALSKLDRLSGAQFDADVVPALEAAVSRAPTQPAPAPS